MDSMIKIPGSYPRDRRSSPPIVNKLISSNSGAQPFTEFTPQVTALLSKYDARVSRETARSILQQQLDTVDMGFECLSKTVGFLSSICSVVCALCSGYVIILSSPDELWIYLHYSSPKHITILGR